MESTTPPTSNPVELVKNMNKKTISVFIYTGVVIIALYLVWTFYTMSTKENTTCKRFDSLYGKMNGKISSAYTSTNSGDFDYMFRDYYIKTAYNCCSTGDYKNGIVSTCALKSVMKQGARGLDFEIYSIGDEPVVATSTEHNNYVKETLNSVKFSDVMNMLTSYAFAAGTVPNPLDPIIVHIRFKSTNVAMYNNLAKILKSHASRLLDATKYGNENNYENFGKVPLETLMGKIVIIVNNNNRTFADVPSFFKYVNMSSGSIFCRKLSVDEVVNNPNTQELTEYNRRNMTICTPNELEMSPPNPSSVLCRNLGIQMVAVRYQESDVNLEEQTFFFNKENHAFVLKPAKFRYIQKCVPIPKKQDPALSFAPRKLEGPLGSKYSL
jgi:hypothetical protein